MGLSTTALALVPFLFDGITAALLLCLIFHPFRLCFVFPFAYCSPDRPR
jgi:hypothetical protein